jgi:Arc/MetJ-type ribon-helix-helix transcriptional regulator
MSDAAVELEILIASEMARGEYATREELLRAAIVALQDQRHLSEFRAQLAKRIESLDRGEGIVLKGEEELHEFMDGLDRRFAREYGLEE